MFRQMRRFKQQLETHEVEAIFERATSGVLAVMGDEEYPYAVPLSFVYSEGKIYFHTSKSGHKMDAIRRCDKVSFCVIDQDDVDHTRYTTRYTSVIAFGRARIIDDPEEKIAALKLLGSHYNSNAYEDAFLLNHIEKDGPRADVVQITIEHMSGKRG